MSYRTIALASCLLMVGCGGAPPPPASPPAVAGHAGDRGPAPPASASPKDDAITTPPGAAMPTTPPVEGGTPAPPLHTGGGGGGGTDKSSLTQAVVEVREPLGGKLTPDDIRRILDKHGDLFGDCYTLGAGGKAKDFKGVVTLKATIGPNGDTNQVDVTKSTTQNFKVDACVSEAFKKIKFQRPKGGATTVIIFPVAFNGIEQVQ